MCNLNGNTFSFIPCVCYFSYLLWIAASEGRSLTKLIPTKMRGEGNSHKTSASLLHSIRVPSLLPHLCKHHKKPEVEKKIQACETLTLTEGFVSSLCRCLKQTVSCLLTQN